MDELPDDILTDIFSRVSTRFLARLSSTCKKLNALISNPDFIKYHLKCRKQSRQSQKVLAIGCHNRNISLMDFEYVSTSFTLLECTSWGFQRARMTYPLLRDLRGIDIVGSCDGLICLVIKDMLYLWNPSNVYLRMLPKVYELWHGYGPCYRTYGLGYDVESDDYKVVRVCWVYEDLHRRTNKEFMSWADVFSLKSNSWRRIPNVHARVGEIKHQYQSVYVNGALHWILQRSTKILSLSLGKEEKFSDEGKFSNLPLRGNLRRDAKLTIHNGRLCVYSCADFWAQLEAWELRPYGWAKIIDAPTVAMGKPNVVELLSLRNGMILVIANKKTFRIENGKEVDCYPFYDTGCHGEDDHCQFIFSVCEDSLISPYYGFNKKKRAAAPCSTMLSRLTECLQWPWP